MKNTLAVPVDIDFAGTNPFSLDDLVEALEDHREARIFLDLSACGLRWSDCKKIVASLEDFTEIKGEKRKQSLFPVSHSHQPLPVQFSALTLAATPLGPKESFSYVKVPSCFVILKSSS